MEDQQGPSGTSAAKATVKILRSADSWIEGEALRQLQVTAELPGMRAAFGMPDLHPGRGHPIGAAFLADGIIYPYLVGSDIGCGMALFATGIASRKAKRDRWVKDLNIDGIWQDDEAKDAILDRHGVAKDQFRTSLGTIGGGNHFAELLSIDKVVETEAFTGAGLDKGMLYLLVHSGSRGLGDDILRSHTARFGAAGLKAASDDGLAYLSRHDEAVRWAAANRSAIAQRFAEQIGFTPEPLLDLCHNSVTDIGGCWCHRKGAAPHAGNLVVVPGSRGTLSYLISPRGTAAEFGYSLPHGAGRKWSRADARSRLRDRYRVADLQKTALGGAVICEDKDLLFEEAPDAYKNIATVAADLVANGMGAIVATLRPLITYKMRQEQYGDED